MPRQRRRVWGRRKKKDDRTEGEETMSTIQKCASMSKWVFRGCYLVFNFIVIYLVFSIPRSKLYDVHNPTVHVPGRYFEFWFCIVVQWFFYFLVQGTDGGKLTKELLERSGLDQTLLADESGTSTGMGASASSSSSSSSALSSSAGGSGEPGEPGSQMVERKDGHASAEEEVGLNTEGESKHAWGGEEDDGGGESKTGSSSSSSSSDRKKGGKKGGKGGVDGMGGMGITLRYYLCGDCNMKVAVCVCKDCKEVYCEDCAMAVHSKRSHMDHDPPLTIEVKRGRVSLVSGLCRCASVPLCLCCASPSHSHSHPRIPIHAPPPPLHPHNRTTRTPCRRVSRNRRRLSHRRRWKESISPSVTHSGTLKYTKIRTCARYVRSSSRSGASTAVSASRCVRLSRVCVCAVHCGEKATDGIDALLLLLLLLSLLLFSLQNYTNT